MPDYRSGAGIGMGLTMLGGGIGQMLAAKRQRKYMEEMEKRKLAFLKAISAQQRVPGASGQYSELAKMLARVGSNLPPGSGLQEHAATLNQLVPGFQQNEASIRAANAKKADLQPYIESGIPEAQDFAIQQLLPQEGKKPFAMSVSGGYLVQDPSTGELQFHRTEEKDPDWGTYIGDDGREHYAPKSEIYESGKPISLPKTVDDWSWEDAGKNASGEPLERRVYTAFDPLTKNVQTFKTESTRVKQPTGTNLTVNTGDMGKPTLPMRTDLQKSISKANVTMDRLESVRSQWNPNWSYIETQGWQFVKGAIDKSKLLSSTVGRAISEESWNDFSAYKAWDRDMQSTINTHIHDMTGAQMSQAEIKRLLLEMATKSDGAKAYKAKIDATISMLASAKKQWERMLNEGVMSVEEAQAAMDEIIVANLKMIAGEGENDQPSWANPVE